MDVYRIDSDVYLESAHGSRLTSYIAGIVIQVPGGDVVVEIPGVPRGIIPISEVCIEIPNSSID
jgi:hypothetical protein